MSESFASIASHDESRNISWLISEYALSHTHNLVSDSGRLCFVRVADINKTPSVYVWIAYKSDIDYHILYVGKAGRGVHARCHQHKGGFTNSNTGQKNATELMKYLDAGYELRVYGRKSSTMEIFGKVVSLYSAEEDALCEVLKPSINRAGFPNVDSE